MNTRSSTKINNISKKEGLLPLPNIESFQHAKLPLLKEVLSVLYKKNDTGLTFPDAVKETAALTEKHWTDRNIYTISHQTCVKKLDKAMKDYKYLLSVDDTKKTGWYRNKCKDMNKQLDSLFDIFCYDKKRLAKLEKEYGVPMSEDDYAFLSNMKSDRTFTCGSIDTLYHKKQEEKKRKLDKRLKNESTSFVSVSFNDDECTEDTGDKDFVIEEKENEPPSKKRLIFRDISTPAISVSTRSTRFKESNNNFDPNHTEHQTHTPIHVRQSKNSVLSEIYHACAEMEGENFSLREMQVALKVVGNVVFKTNWKIPDEKDRSSKYENDKEDPEDKLDESFIDSDTLPTRSAIRKKLKQIHAYSLGLVADKISDAASEGDIITHATDSTTRKHVGTFAPSGLHINRETYLPLPTLKIASETTENIAEGIKSTFEMLSCASSSTASELYGKVDVHMTDSTAYNKGVAKRKWQRNWTEQILQVRFSVRHIQR